MNKTVLTQNDSRRSFHKKSPYSSILGETVITNIVLAQNNGKRSLLQKFRCRSRLSVTLPS